ncbi:chemotaxis-specific protein-glutamate methyltransferase CheB [bacterium]|nr:chemotaxis-specific protein-glutamate methyltransferase CheB [bacterium]
MSKIKILIVDDSVVTRRVVSDALSGDSQLEIIGVAANGRIALEKISRLEPDLVTLDLEMPEMDGLQTLSAIRKSHPDLPVIIFSSLTARGAAATLDALSHGANDYVTKPANLGDVSHTIEHIRKELIPKIKCFCLNDVRDGRFSRRVDLPKPAVSQPAISVHHRKPARIVAIGVSTGGPKALEVLLSQLPADFPAPVVIVQHMPPIFTKSLAEHLASKAKIPIDEARSDDVLKPGHVWIAPGDQHMVLERVSSSVTIRLHQGPPENFCRPSADILFRSVAKIYGPGLRSSEENHPA